jgi:hypothetical protein
VKSKVQTMAIKIEDLTPANEIEDLTPDLIGQITGGSGWYRNNFFWHFPSRSTYNYRFRYENTYPTQPSPPKP